MIIHIGQPKTATTTLQNAVFDYSPNQRWYLGKFREKSSAVQEIMNAVLYQKVPQDILKSKLDKEIKKRTGEVLLFSDEMFLVDTDIKWQQKLDLLGNFLSNYDVEWLVTTRVPSRLLPSLYAELMITSGAKSFADFIESNQAKIANLHYLYDCISPLKGEVHFLDYDEIISSQFSILERLVPDVVIPRFVSNLNSREKYLEGFRSRSFTLREHGSRVLRRLGLMSFLMPGLRKKAGSFFEHFKMGQRWIDASTFSKLVPQDLDDRYVAFYGALRKHIQQF